ncbi:ECF transporter S component [Bacillus massilinigeriensis]|uniref:ECF transporter S component n=1 Tax=Bacillus massilionigeriensis TaxID=1805475 RepID=UPI00096AFC22|nr:ECF transporter S component [Bacillus massilionigeriensis]
MKNQRIKMLVAIGMFSSIAYLLMLLNFPLPMFPSFLLIDFSDLPALMATLIFGPLAGILVELIKNILDYFMTGSETGIPIGHASNFIAGLLFILPTYYIYQKLKTKKGMTLALVIGSVTMAVIMSFLNYFVFLPAYTFFVNMPAMAAAEAIKYIAAGILPFNIVKGLAMSIVFMLIFTRMHSWIGKQSSFRNA